MGELVAMSGDAIPADAPPAVVGELSKKATERLTQIYKEVQAMGGQFTPDQVRQVVSGLWNDYMASLPTGAGVTDRQARWAIAKKAEQALGKQAPEIRKNVAGIIMGLAVVGLSSAGQNKEG